LHFLKYPLWDGRKIIVDKSKNNLEGLRNFFKDIGDYVEHSQLSNTADTSDGMALDVVFVYIKSWCQKYQTLIAYVVITLHGDITQNKLFQNITIDVNI
jgi:hypothetical protein